MNGHYGEGLAAVAVVQQWIDAAWPFAITMLAFCIGYVVGGIVQRG